MEATTRFVHKAVELAKSRLDNSDHAVPLPYIPQPERQPTSGLDFAAAVAEALAARLERHFQVEPTFTLDQAAKMLGCSNEFLRKLCEAREIPHIKLGKLYRIKAIDLNNYLERNYHHTKEA